MRTFFSLSLVSLAIASFAGCSGGDDPPGAGASDGGADGSATADGGDGSAPGTLSFVPSNLGTLDLSGALGDLTLDDCGPQLRDERIGCDGPGEVYRVETVESGGTKIRVYIARNIRIVEGRELAVLASTPVALVALENIELAGGIRVTPGMAGGAESSASGKDGNGPGAGKAAAATSGSTAGGGGYCGRGGNGSVAGAPGGATYGSPELSPLVGGSSGGGLLSGVGGGAIQLVAGGSIVVSSTGYVDAPGDGATGGGGSGGAILLEAPVVRVQGSLTANGGGGGGPGGQDGATGTRTSTRAAGGNEADAAGGGAGGAGSDLDGAPGKLNVDYPDGAFSGRGGGGVGRIRIHTRTGSAEISGLVSPSLGTACATEGTLRSE